VVRKGGGESRSSKKVTDRGGPAWNQSLGKLQETNGGSGEKEKGGIEVKHSFSGGEKKKGILGVPTQGATCLSGNFVIVEKIGKRGFAREITCKDWDDDDRRRHGVQAKSGGLR